MSDTDANKDETKAIEAPKAPINILAQYIRDLSFENPKAPESLRAGAAAPDMDISVGMDARKIPDDEMENLYEVVLSLRAVALRDGEPVFIAEIQYGVTVILENVPEDSHHAVLLIEIPRLAFPYAREIMANLTMNGGYPPLMLNPVDFQALYMERFKDDIEKARAELQEKGSAEIKKDSVN